jgi:hypothetical protein
MTPQGCDVSMHAGPVGVRPVHVEALQRVLSRRDVLPDEGPHAPDHVSDLRRWIEA